MKFEEKLKKTLYDVCSLGDLKKICKARKFPPLPSSVKKEEYAQYVERKFATEEGVEEVCKTLSAEELNILRVLCALENPLTLSDVYYFFDEEDDDFFEKKKLEEIKTRLLWKGLVLLYPSREYESGRCLHAHFSLIEFPRQFEKFIPPLFIPLKPIEKNPPIEDWRKLAKSILLTDFQEKNNKENRFFSLQGGILSCGGIKNPSIENLYEVFSKSWLKICATKSSKFPNPQPWTEEQLGNIRRYLLEKIPQDKMIAKKELFILFANFGCDFDESSKDQFIKFGIEFGFLGVILLNGEEYFTIHIHEEKTILPETPLVFEEKGDRVRFSLKSEKDLVHLLTLAKISSVDMENDLFFFKPDGIKLGSFYESIPGSWIEECKKISTLYRGFFERIEMLRKKIFVHSNLIIFRIKSLDIRMVFIENFGEKMWNLGKDYFAVSKEDYPIFLECAKKKGFVAKILRRNTLNGSIE